VQLGIALLHVPVLVKHDLVSQSRVNCISDKSRNGTPDAKGVDDEAVHDTHALRQRLAALRL
jgi:hypothetical protein